MACRDRHKMALPRAAGDSMPDWLSAGARPARAPAFAWTRGALEARDGIGNGAEPASFEAVQRPGGPAQHQHRRGLRSGTADDGRRKMAETRAWGGFVDTQIGLDDHRFRGPV
jgi:hypothetical protein